MAYINDNEVLFSPQLHIGEDYAAGRQAEYDAFWDACQKNGQRVTYRYGFMGESWNDTTFRPKYDMRPDWSIVSMFYECQITNLEKILNDCGVILDTSNNGNYGSAFSSTTFTVLPEIVFSRHTSQAGQVFSNCKSLHTIRKVTFTEGATAVWTSVFENCTALANVVFAGVVASNINLQWSPLTVESATSLIMILKDYSGTSNAFAYSVYFSSTTKALLDGAGAIFPNGATWYEYLLQIGWNG